MNILGAQTFKQHRNVPRVQYPFLWFESAVARQQVTSSVCQPLTDHTLC